MREQLGASARRFAETAKFEPKAGQFAAAAGRGRRARAASCSAWRAPSRPDKDRFLPGRLPGLLPAGTYRFANAPHDTRLAALAFALGSYRFTPLPQGERRTAPRLAVPDGVDGDELSRIADGVALARDLINTPANDMGPAELEQAARDLAARHGAGIRAIVGDDLLKQNFPLIHAVGRASPRAPRLIDLTWGDAAHPKITLVGKGVCFDTGGLDIKPDSGMLIMKKDMGGAANVLAAAHMIMDAKLKVRLRVLIPAVENAISGDAFRPLDVYRSRKGITVEIGNTDAEGRLVLADALALADEETPDLIVDMATLTGAARVALGPELPPFFTHDDEARVGSGAPCRGGARSAMAPAAVAAVRLDARFQDRRHQQCRRRPGGRDHGRAVPQPLRHRREGLGAFRHLRLDAERQAGAPRWRRVPGRARALCAAEGAVLLDLSRRAEKKSQNNPMQRTNSGMGSSLMARLRSETIRLRNDQGRPMAVELRPSQALKLLQDFAFALVTDGEPDLSARQLSILLTIYLQPPPHTVRGLAARLKVTKPVITRALDTMGKLELVARRRDEADRRNVVIQRTPKGALAVERLGDVLIAKARELPR